ncbi:hypothetical protein QZH41_018834 [Actinostola sp. cb2023]|nr:hypothetical protein QZH41_018834 [Actinostola sp. cb2023]
MRDETGIVPVPTIHVHVGEQDENIEEQMLSNRSRRTILRAINASVRCDENSQQGHVHEESEGININNSDFHTCSSANNVPCSQESVDEPMQKDVYTQTKNCVECSKLKEENRQLRNKCIDLKETKQDLMKQKTSIGVQCDMYYEKLVSGVSDHEMEEQVEYEREEYEGMDVHVEAESSFMSDDDDDDDSQSEASGADAPFQGDTEADDPQELNESLHNGNLRTEPKFITCLSKLMLLFQFCHLCKADSPMIESHDKLFPTILLHWRKYQSKMIEEIKESEESVVVAGDCRHDSMGHCAKYGTYTMFCCSKPQIIHFELVQRNEAGNSGAMEMIGFKRSLSYLLGCGLAISTFISDRHSSIAKYMREQMTGITHYFDLWHLKKSVRKALTKIACESKCEALKEWIYPCLNHLHWSATTTLCGTGRIILAKFHSFLGHIVNKHENLDDPLFNRCSHGNSIKQRKWLQPESDAHFKLVSTLTNPRLVSGIMKASPLAQTSCLEGFHSVLNHFSPKMISYSYSGMLCRHILASIHFNFNLIRDTKQRPDGTPQVKLVYPKFKDGVASVRDVRVRQNFGYVDDIYNTFLEANGKPGLMKTTKQELKDMNPLPMNSMLQKEPREKALSKKRKRQAWQL